MSLTKKQAAEVAERTKLTEWQVQQIAKFANVKPTVKQKDKKNG